MRNIIKLSVILVLIFLFSCAKQKKRSQRPSNPKFTLQLASSVMDKNKEVTFHAIMEYKDDGHFIKGYFVYPIAEIKYPGYELVDFKAAATNHIEKFKQLNQKKKPNESVIIHLTGKIKSNGPVTWQINPETHPFGKVYEFSIVEMYIGSTPNWRAYKVKEKK